MKYSSFSIFLNFILVLLIIFGWVYFDKKETLCKRSVQEFKKEYISKKDIKFSDLRKSERKRYLYIGSPYDFITSDPDVEDENATSRYIQGLKNKLIVVQKDNLLLYDEKESIEKRLFKIKKELIKQKQLLLSQSLEQMNEAEQQHYENISELRERLNDLQRENIDLLQDENEKVISLKNRIKMLEQKLNER